MTQSVTKLRELELTIVRKEEGVALESEEKLFFLPDLGLQQYKQKTMWTVLSAWCKSMRVLSIQALSFYAPMGFILSPSLSRVTLLAKLRFGLDHHRFSGIYFTYLLLWDPHL